MCRGIGPIKNPQFKKNKDGYLAWQKLVNYYHAKGNKRAYAKACLSNILSLYLDPNSPGGVDKYISDFESLLLKLQEAGDPVSDNQQVTMFLENIRDRNYNAFKTLCTAEDYSFDKCVQELRNEAIRIHGESSGKEQSRRTNVQTTQSSTENLGESKFRLPKEVWNKLSWEQKKLYNSALKSWNK